MKRAVHIEVALTNIAPIKHVVNAVQYMCTGIAQLLAKSAINVVTKIILVHVVDRTWARTKDVGEIEHKLTAGVQRDVTDPAEADVWGPDRGHDPVENQWHHNAHSIEVDRLRHRWHRRVMYISFHLQVKDGCQPWSNNTRPWWQN